MSNEEILKKAIEKAIKNGWDYGGWKYWQVVIGGVGFWDKAAIDFAHARASDSGELRCVEEIIFSHDFAKAFWGDIFICRVDGYLMRFKKDESIARCTWCEGTDGQFKWKWHLQQMVLEKDPIKYLEQFL